MDETAKKLLKLMFRPGETICVSPNEFGYRSISLDEAMNGPVVLFPTQNSLDARGLTLEEAIERPHPSTLILLALNPIKGYREDQNCTAFRNFLVELDFGPLNEQMAYIQKMGMPYSAVIFSGNKSLHFLISLDRDLPNEDAYRLVSEWTLKIMSMADQNTQNPSRSIRIPGAWRTPTKQQTLREFKGPVTLKEMSDWLTKFPNYKPSKKQKNQISTVPNDLTKVKDWVKVALKNGLDPTKGRNKQWFSIACEFALAGFSEDDTIRLLSTYFSPDRDFKEKEWLKSISQGFKYVYDRKA